MSVLIVEPNPAVGNQLRAVSVTVARTALCLDFSAGREALYSFHPQVLITNLRLEDYNGLHLVLLSRMLEAPPRALVHTDRPDFLLTNEALAMGAFFERTERLPYCLLAFLEAELPPEDRRNPAQPDRRQVPRGGRRGGDQLPFRPR
jgi:hypothetical protein